MSELRLPLDFLRGVSRASGGGCPGGGGRFPRFTSVLERNDSRYPKREARSRIRPFDFLSEPRHILSERVCVNFEAVPFVELVLGPIYSDRSRESNEPGDYRIECGEGGMEDLRRVEKIEAVLRSVAPERCRNCVTYVTPPTPMLKVRLPESLRLREGYALVLVEPRSSFSERGHHSIFPDESEGVCSVRVLPDLAGRPVVEVAQCLYEVAPPSDEAPVLPGRPEPREFVDLTRIGCPGKSEEYSERGSDEVLHNQLDRGVQDVAGNEDEYRRYQGRKRRDCWRRMNRERAGLRHTAREGCAVV